ncbi:uncharacterized protein [Odocoileus virginianus]|uniref:Protamine-2 n=1 Tax=Odocoileus virginianus TaxID=9874 RepID=A0A6J0WES2_ODOVR
MRTRATTISWHSNLAQGVLSVIRTLRPSCLVTGPQKHRGLTSIYEHHGAQVLGIRHFQASHPTCKAVLMALSWQASCCLSPSCPPVTPFSTMVRCRVKSPTESPTGQQGSGQQGETERPEETQELRPEDIPVYGRTQRGRYHYRHRSHTRRRPCRRRRRRACRHRRRRRGSAGPPCAPIPGTPQASRPGLRLPKDEEKEEEMRKAALSFPGPTRKSHLPGSTSQDHSKSPLEPTRS